MKTSSYPVLLSLDYQPIVEYLKHEAWLNHVEFEDTNPSLHANVFPKHSYKFQIGRYEYVLTKVKYQYNWLYRLSKVFELPF